MDYHEDRNDDEVLIKLVNSFPYIYDKKHNLFKSKGAKGKAWLAIGLSLRKKPGECEQRWNILRHRYVTEKRKLREDPSVKTSAWPLYNLMGFLNAFIYPRKSQWSAKSTDWPNHDDSVESLSPYENISSAGTTSPQNIITEHSPRGDMKQLRQEVTIKQEEIEYEFPESPPLVVATEPSSSTERSNDVSKIIHTDTHSPKYKHSDDKLIASIGTVLEMLGECLKKSHRTEKEDQDPDLAFGKTVALHLKEMKNRRKSFAKIEIMKILLSNDSDEDSDLDVRN